MVEPMLEHLTRQFDLIPIGLLNQRINIIGAGAIGSFVTLQLAKMGFENLHVWDYDKVSVENMSCQFFRFGDIGQTKTTALKSLVKDFTGTGINIYEERYEKGELPGIVVSAVDSMKARSLIWENHKGRAMFTNWIIDPRMSALDACLYTAKPMRLDHAWVYEKTLYSDESAVQERCTAKSTMFTVNMISGLVVKTVVDCLKNIEPISQAQWAIQNNDLLTFKREERVS